MVQAIITIGEHEDRVITIIKGKYGLKTKSDAINLMINKFEEQLLEPQLRPEYVEKLKKIKKEKSHTYQSISQLKNKIENAQVRDKIHIRKKTNKNL